MSTELFPGGFTTVDPDQPRHVVTSITIRFGAGADDAVLFAVPLGTTGAPETIASELLGAIEEQVLQWLKVDKPFAQMPDVPNFHVTAAVDIQHCPPISVFSESSEPTRVDPDRIVAAMVEAAAFDLKVQLRNQRQAREY